MFERDAKSVTGSNIYFNLDIAEFARISNQLILGNHCLSPANYTNEYSGAATPCTSLLHHTIYCPIERINAFRRAADTSHDVLILASGQFVRWRHGVGGSRGLVAGA